MSPEAQQEIERSQVEEARFKAKVAIYQAREAFAKANLAELLLEQAKGPAGQSSERPATKQKSLRKPSKVRLFMRPIDLLQCVDRHIYRLSPSFGNSGNLPSKFFIFVDGSIGEGIARYYFDVLRTATEPDRETIRVVAVNAEVSEAPAASDFGGAPSISSVRSMIGYYIQARAACEKTHRTFGLFVTADSVSDSLPSLVSEEWTEILVSGTWARGGTIMRLEANYRRAVSERKFSEED